MRVLQIQNSTGSSSCLQCIDTVAWASQRASGLQKTEWWGVGVVICLEQGADCLQMVQLLPLHPKTPSALASFKSRLVLSFWYQLTQVVPENRPLNRCSMVVVVLVVLMRWRLCADSCHVSNYSSRDCNSRAGWKDSQNVQVKHKSLLAQIGSSGTSLMHEWRCVKTLLA